MLAVLTKKLPYQIIRGIMNAPYYGRAYRVKRRALESSFVQVGLRQLDAMKQGSVTSDGRKYLRSRCWLFENSLRLVQVGLDRRSPCHILDLGSGAGYFMALARVYGHQTEGIDLGEHEIYTPVNRAFGNIIHWHAITSEQPFPPCEWSDRFDVVTAFSVTFDQHDSNTQLWSIADWCIFLRHLAGVLKPGALVIFQMNIRTYAGCLGSEYAIFRSDELNAAGYTCEYRGRRRIRLRYRTSP